ncbi:terminase small subunit [Mucilaginibacter sp. AW1-3]
MELILTPKQQKFCDEYLIDLNATKAALRAGYSGSTALSGALMRIPKIAYYLQQRTEEVSRKAKINHEMLLTELSKIAFGNMRNYYHSDGTMKGVHELTDDEAAALWCMKITDGKDGQTSFIRLNNKLSALEKIARHLRFYDMEEEEPEKEYVFLDSAKLDDDDTFDDELFEDEENEDDDDYYDEDADEYYPWDTECKVAVAQARAACKARRGDSPEVGSSESEEFGESLESEDDDEWADPAPVKYHPLPAPQYLTNETSAILLKPNCPPLGEGWQTVRKIPEGMDPTECNKAWKVTLKQWKQGVDFEESAESGDQEPATPQPAFVSGGLTGRLVDEATRKERKEQAKCWR